MRTSLGARLLFLLASAALAGALVSCGGTEQPRVRLATTTSARDTGLLDWVLPELEKKLGVRVSVVAVGTGQALELARRGDADIVIVHDRPREDAFIASAAGIDRHDLMWNDFVLVGPANDPAGVKSTKEATAALQRISAAAAAFVSRGDDSGTHSREKSLWAKGGGRSPWNGYVESGQGQGPTLLMANERKAYALSDRGTFASMRKKLELVILLEGDPALRNPYGVMLVNPAKVPGVASTDAKKVLEYLISPEGQARIGAFQIEGEPIFHPVASSR